MRKLATALAVIALLAACSGDDDDNGGGDITEVNGIVSTNDGSESGSLFVEVQAAELAQAVRTPSVVAASRAPVPATGEVTIFGSTTDLTGTYDPDTGVLLLDGGGYSFNGTYNGTSITGTWTGPGGAAGTFVAAPGDGVAFCGTYVVTEGGPDEGTFSFVVFGTDARGQAINGDGGIIPLVGETSGELSSTPVTISFFVPGTSVPFAEGDITLTSASGTFDVDGDSGEWTGSPAFCSGQT